MIREKITTIGALELAAVGAVEGDRKSIERLRQLTAKNKNPEALDRTVHYLEAMEYDQRHQTQLHKVVNFLNRAISKSSNKLTVIPSAHIVNAAASEFTPNQNQHSAA